MKNRIIFLLAWIFCTIALATGSYFKNGHVFTDISSGNAVTTTTNGQLQAGTISIAQGGTGQTVASEAFKAIMPPGPAGAMWYIGTNGYGLNLNPGAAGQAITMGTNGLPGWGAGGGGGLSTVGAFGSSANTAGASVSGSTLTLQPADGSNPGGVSTTTQTFAGNKAFTGNVKVGTVNALVSAEPLGVNKACSVGSSSGSDGQNIIMYMSAGVGGPILAGHTDSADKATLNNDAAAIQLGGNGFIVYTMPGVAVGNTRTFTAQFGCDKNKNCIFGSAADGSSSAALATTAAAGFVYIPSMAGTPTGTPTRTPTGYPPIVIDSTNKKLCYYFTTWECSGAFSP